MLMIVLWHLNSLYPGTLPKLGDRGVEFFLLISGFLIARKCEGTASLDSFRSSSSYVFQKIKSSYLLFILPAVLAPLINHFCRKAGWVKDGDMKLS